MENSIAYKFYNLILNNRTDKQAEKILLDSLKYYISNNLLSETVQMNFHLADYYLKTNDKKKSLIHLEKSLGTASENEYISIFENKVFGFRNLLETAFSENIYKDFLYKIINNVLARDQTAWLSDECRKRLSLQIENFYDVQMASFGSLE